MNPIDVSLWCVSILGVGLTLAATVAVVVTLVMSIVRSIRNSRRNVTPAGAWGGPRGRSRWHRHSWSEPTWRADRLRRMQHPSW